MLYSADFVLHLLSWWWKSDGSTSYQDDKLPLCGRLGLAASLRNTWLHNYRRCIIKILFILVQYSVLSLSLKSDYEFYFGSDFDLAFVQVKNFTRKIPANPKYPPTPQQYAFLENTMISYTRSRIQLRRVYFEESHEKPTWNHGKTWKTNLNTQSQLS